MLRRVNVNKRRRNTVQNQCGRMSVGLPNSMIPDTRPSLPSLNQEALNGGIQVWWRSSHLPIRGRLLDVDVTHLGQGSGLRSLMGSQADVGVRLLVDNSLT